MTVESCWACALKSSHSVDANSIVLARLFQTFVDVKLTEGPTEPWQAVAFELGVGQTDARRPVLAAVVVAVTARDVRSCNGAVFARPVYLAVASIVVV